MSDKKLLIGPKVRRLRLDQHLTQAQMAADLEISPTYLNLIESNQRPVSAQVLVKLAGAYDIDLPTFARDEGPEIAAALRQAFAAPSLKALNLSRQDFEDMAALSPEAVDALLTLAALPGREEPILSGQQTGGQAQEKGEASLLNLADEMDPAFAKLEALAHQIYSALSSTEEADFDQRLAAACPFRIDILPASIMGHTLRRYDLHRARLLLHRILPASSRRFQILLQMILQTWRGELASALPSSLQTDAQRSAQALMLAANHVAGAVLMPKGQVRQAMDDLDTLDLAQMAHHFDVTKAQMAQRLARLYPWPLVSFLDGGQMMSQRGLSMYPEWSQTLMCPDWAIHSHTESNGIVQRVALPSGQVFDCHIFTAALPQMGRGQAFPSRTYALILPSEGAGGQPLTPPPYHGLNDLYRRDVRAYVAA